jgi:hypothetical protein
MLNVELFCPSGRCDGVDAAATPRRRDAVMPPAAALMAYGQWLMDREMPPAAARIAYGQWLMDREMPPTAALMAYGQWLKDRV